MIFRGALVRLAAQYFVLLVLILGFFDLIVYVTVSQSLQAKADSDLKHAVSQAAKEVVATDTVSVNAQGLLDPSVADTFFRVLNNKDQEVTQPQPALKKLFNSPNLTDPIAAAKAGQSADTRVSNGTDLYMVHTSAIVNPKSKKVVGVMQVAQPISWVGDSLSGLVRQLVLASAIGIMLGALRQLRLDPRPVELNEVVRGLITQATPLADERGVQLRPDLNGGVRVDADLVRVRQLLLILIDNALAHTPTGGEVSVGVVRQNGRAYVTVTDTGEGIPTSDLPHIFERFYRADKARTRENGGSGLGLAIAKWIVDAHKGEIAVTSAEGRGTEVAISLPAID